jgi:hypothetical protein
MGLQEGYKGNGSRINPIKSGSFGEQFHFFDLVDRKSSNGFLLRYNVARGW